MDWLIEPLQQIQWAILHWMAGLLWAFDRMLLIGGVLIHSLRKWITDPGGLITLVLTQLLQDPGNSQLLKAYIAGAVLLALLLAALWFMLRPLLGAGAGAPVEVRKVLLWLALAGFLFSSGPAFAADMERFRAEMSSGAYRVAVQVNGQVAGQGYNNTGGEVPVTGSQPFSPTVTLFPQTTHVYGIGNPPEYTGIDVAAAYLLAGQEDINGTANGGTGLPGGFEQAYFVNCDSGGQNCAQPWPSGYDEQNRQAALGKALNGVIRMATGITPAVFALLQAFIFLALALAAAVLFFSLPLALVFAFFNTTEVIALAVVRAYLGLLVKTYVTATFLALFMGFLIYWGSGGNWVGFLGMELLILFFTWQLARLAVQTITESLNTVTQAVGQATGTQWTYVDPPKMVGQATGVAATVALAAATGGTGLALGSLVSGMGGALGVPGASTLGTALALGSRRRRSSIADSPSEETPTGWTGAGTPDATDGAEPDFRENATGHAVPKTDSTIIDGEWYEVREAQQRRTRAERWLTAHGIPPMDTPPPPHPANGGARYPASPPPVAASPRAANDAAAPPHLDSLPDFSSHPDAAPTVQLVLHDGALGLSRSALLPAPAADEAATTPPPATAWGTEPIAIPAALRERAQWVAWRYEEVDGRRTKIPYNPRTGRRARSNDPATWGTSEEAEAAVVLGGYEGIGFMIHPADPFVGVDLDHCFDSQTGTLLPWAEDIVQKLDSYTEVSPSGSGIRIFTRGTLPPRELGRREGPVEMYDDRRFLSVTGQHLAGTPATVEDRADALGQLHRQVFRKRYAAAQAPTAPAAAPHVDSNPPSLTDTAILNKIQRAKNAASFERLWQGDIAGYESASEADLALCGMLAFYTQDPAQIERLVAQSGLWDEKWRNRPAYRQATIQQAIANRSGTYTGATAMNRSRRRARATSKQEADVPPPSETIVLTPTATDEPGREQSQPDATVEITATIEEEKRDAAEV